MDPISAFGINRMSKGAGVKYTKALGDKLLSRLQPPVNKSFYLHTYQIFEKFRMKLLLKMFGLWILRYL